MDFALHGKLELKIESYIYVHISSALYNFFLSTGISLTISQFLIVIVIILSCPLHIGDAEDDPNIGPKDSLDILTMILKFTQIFAHRLPRLVLN